MKHDPERAAEFFDHFTEREWARFDEDDPTTPSTSLDVHLEYLRRYVNAGDRVLDVGAGPGRFTIELAHLGASIVVADISPGQLAFNREKVAEAGHEDAVEDRVVADVVDLPFEVASFDVTVCYGGPISYVVERGTDAVAELARVTRPGGHVLVSVMSLVGAVQTFADGVIEVAEMYGIDLTEQIITTGLLPEGPELGHLAMKLYRWRELRELLEPHGEIIAASATGLIRPTTQPDDPELRSLLARIELELSREPGALDCAPHILAVVRRPAA
jgi:ubiquinone/menaquinone biosynthesis C-methylase UbiE